MIGLVGACRLNRTVLNNMPMLLAVITEFFRIVKGNMAIFLAIIALCNAHITTLPLAIDSICN
jgi:hypothetical protein